jgi:hypothetical protein
MLLRTVPLKRMGSCGMAAMRPRTSCAEARHRQPTAPRHPALREGTGATVPDVLSRPCDSPGCRASTLQRLSRCLASRCQPRGSGAGAAAAGARRARAPAHAVPLHACTSATSARTENLQGLSPGGRACRPIASRLWPSRTMSPACGSASRNSATISELLPLPVRPTMPTFSALPTANVTPCARHPKPGGAAGARRAASPRAARARPGVARGRLARPGGSCCRA